MTRRWQIEVRSEIAEVSGFTKASKARQHVEKHFFNPGERWEQLAGEPSPIVLRNQFNEAAEATGRKSSPQAYTVLDAAWHQYEAAIETCTTGSDPVRTETYTHKPDEGGRPFSAISIVSKSGVFSAFSQGGLSELRTSFRPKIKRPYRGPVKSRDYLNVALNYLNGKLSISRELLGH